MTMKRTGALWRGFTIAACFAMLAAACGSDSDTNSSDGGSPGTSAANGGASSNGGNGGGADGEPWRIPLVNDVSGTLAVTFLPAYAGFQAYMDLINEDGGVHGRLIEVELHDGQSNPDAALTEAQRILDGSPLVFSHMGSSAAHARIAPMVAAEGIPYMGGSLGDEMLFPPQPGIYQVGLTAGVQGRAMATQIESLVGSLDGAKVSIIGGNSPYVDAVISSATDALEESGAEIGLVERFDFGIPSFSAQASSIARDDADAVILLGPANDTITIGSALSAAGVTAPVINYNGASALEVFERLSETGLRYYAPTEVTFPVYNEEMLEVARRHGHEDDVAASTFSAAGWAMAAIIVEALEICGPDCNPETFDESLQSITNFEIPMGVYVGPVNFGPDDHVSAERVLFMHMDPATGEFVDVDPIEVN